MAIRFRKSKKLGKGVRLNIGKGSASVRLGGRNAGVTLGTKSRGASISLPGTGLGISSQKRGGCLGTAVVLVAAMLGGGVALLLHAESPALHASAIYP